jgi:FMN phosphatase YigB (HAD superfamily)
LSRLGLQPNEAAYVGDNPRHDIAPVQSLGMVGIYASRSSKYPLGEVRPDHTIDHFGDLRTLLREVYGVPLPAHG